VNGNTGGRYLILEFGPANTARKKNRSVDSDRSHNTRRTSLSPYFT
jgi:hypothetical protein